MPVQGGTRERIRRCTDQLGDAASAIDDYKQTQSGEGMLSIPATGDRHDDQTHTFGGLDQAMHATAENHETENKKHKHRTGTRLDCESHGDSILTRKHTQATTYFACPYTHQWRRDWYPDLAMMA